MTKTAVTSCLLLIGVACSDGMLSDVDGLGREHDVKCYSGGTLIYEGTSTGTVESGRSLYFRDKKSGRLVYLRADCVVLDAESRP